MASRGQQMRKNASLNEGEHEGRGGRFHGGQWEAGNREGEAWQRYVRFPFLYSVPWPSLTVTVFPAPARHFYRVK